MLIALTVNYVIEADEKEDFFKNGQLRPEIRTFLDSRFPRTISLSARVQGCRNSLTHVVMTEGGNFVRCVLCGRPLSISDTLYLGLDGAAGIDGQYYCPSCAYDIRTDRLHASAKQSHTNQSFSYGDE